MRHRSLGFALLLLLAIPVAAQEKTLLAAGDPWPPFLDPSQPQLGLTVELVRSAYATQGYTVKVAVVPWARAENGVREGRYDVLLNVWMTEERKAYLVYTHPFALNEVTFIKRKGDPFTFEGFASLKGKRIGVIRGYGYEEAFLRSDLFQRDEATSLMENVHKLLAKRIDLTLDDAIVAQSVIASNDPALLERVQFVEKGLSINPLHLASGKANPRAQELVEAFNRGLARIKADGTYQKILKRYGIRLP